MLRRLKAWLACFLRRAANRLDPIGIPPTLADTADLKREIEETILRNYNNERARVEHAYSNVAQWRPASAAPAGAAEPLEDTLRKTYRKLTDGLPSLPEYRGYDELEIARQPKKRKPAKKRRGRKAK